MRRACRCALAKLPARYFRNFLVLRAAPAIDANQLHRCYSSSSKRQQQFGRGQLGDLDAIRRRRHARKAVERVTRAQAQPQSNDLTGTSTGQKSSDHVVGLDRTQDETIVGVSKFAYIGDPRYAPVHMRGSVVEHKWFGGSGDDVEEKAHLDTLRGSGPSEEHAASAHPAAALDRPASDAELIYYRWTQPFMLRMSLLPAASCGLLGLGAMVAKFVAPVAFQPEPVVPVMLLGTAVTVFWLCRRVALGTPRDAWLADGGGTLAWRSHEYPFKGAGQSIVHAIPVHSLSISRGTTGGSDSGSGGFLPAAPEDSESMQVRIRGLERMPPLDVYLPGGLPEEQEQEHQREVATGHVGTGTDNESFSSTSLSSAAEARAAAAAHRLRARHEGGVYVADEGLLRSVLQGDASAAARWHAAMRGSQEGVMSS